MAIRFSFFLLTAALFTSHAQATPSYEVKLCARSSGPESMDPTIVSNMCFVSLRTSGPRSGLLVSLNSGKKLLFAIRQYDSASETILVEDTLTGSTFEIAYLLKDGRPYRLAPIRGENYPFNRYFDVVFN